MMKCHATLAQGLCSGLVAVTSRNNAVKEASVFKAQGLCSGLVAVTYLSIKMELFAKSSPRWFKAAEAQALIAELGRIDMHTSLSQVVSVNDVMLDGNGKTKSGLFKYTESAFLQICRLLAPGLAALLTHLVTHPTISSRFRKQQAAEAIRIFNALVDFRLEKLISLRMLCDTHLQRIDGFLGPGHRPLNNLAFYEEAAQAMQGASPAAAFHSAGLLGRRFNLRFRSIEPIFTLKLGKQPVPFYWVWCFTNGETTGFSLRAAAGLVGPTGTSLLPGKRAAHAVQGFETRLRKLFTAAVRMEPKPVELQAAVERLLAMPLGFSAKPQDPAPIMHALTKFLVRHGLPTYLAQQVVREATHRGWARDDLDHALPQTLAKRTYFDLYCALVFEARRLSLEQRLKIEQFAHTFLASNFRPVSREIIHGQHANHT